MYLDAVSRSAEFELPIARTNAAAKTAEVFRKWKDWPPSQISHHGNPCCEIARAWIGATDFTSLGGGNIFSGPRWLRHRFKWGASNFPIHWCEAVERKTLDCGALAALAHEVFSLRGIKSYRVQLVQRYSPIAIDQWTRSWSESGGPLEWLENDLIYHEGGAIVTRENEIKIWDASAGWWIDARSGNGYGSLVAIKVTAGDGTPALRWEEYLIVPNTWQAVQD